MKPENIANLPFSKVIEILENAEIRINGKKSQLRNASIKSDFDLMFDVLSLPQKERKEIYADCERLICCNVCNIFKLLKKHKIGIIGIMSKMEWNDDQADQWREAAAKQEKSDFLAWNAKESQR